MSEFFNYNPHNGVRETFDWDGDKHEAHFKHDQVLDAHFDMTAEARNTGRMRKGMMDGGREFHCYASLSMVTQLELRKKGIDIYSKDPAMIRRMFQEINRNYPKEKVTDMIHE